MIMDEDDRILLVLRYPITPTRVSCLSVDVLGMWYNSRILLGHISRNRWALYRRCWLGFHEPSSYTYLWEISLTITYQKTSLPTSPSPTTTIFFEYEGPSVICVAADSLPVEALLIMVLTVPSLDLWLCSRRVVFFLRGAASYFSDTLERLE